MKNNIADNKRLLKQENDDICRQIVRLKHGNKCQVSGLRHDLECCHFYHRKACPSTRWNLDNLFLFYSSVHQFFDTKCRKAFKEIALSILGTERFAELSNKAMVAEPKNLRYYEEENKRLKAILEGYKGESNMYCKSYQM